MRQFGVGLEDGFVHPSRMNDKEPPVAHRPEGVETQAASFVSRRPGYVAQGLLHGILLPLTRMQPHKDILVHGPLHLCTSFVSASHATLLLIWWRVEERARTIVPLRGRRSEEPGSRTDPRHGRGRRERFRPATTCGIRSGKERCRPQGTALRKALWISISPALHYCSFWGDPKEPSEY